MPAHTRSLEPRTKAGMKSVRRRWTWTSTAQVFEARMEMLAGRRTHVDRALQSPGDAREEKEAMLKPDFEREGVKLYLGDCRDVLPHLEGVDAVVTDPPYGIGFKYESHDDNEEAYGQLMVEVVGHVERLRGTGPAVFWQGMLNCHRWHQWFPSPFRLFAACKGFVQYRPTPVQFSWDPVVWWGEPKGEPSVLRKDWHLQNLAPFGAGRERVNHPCPRPVEQVEYVVGLFSCDGDTVLDPFLGSGTTALACIRQDRQVVGIEKDPSYFAEAVSRIQSEFDRTKLFAAEVQAELFGANE